VVVVVVVVEVVVGNHDGCRNLRKNCRLGDECDMKSVILNPSSLRAQLVPLLVLVLVLLLQVVDSRRFVDDLDP